MGRSGSRSRGGEFSRIQRLVDERQQYRRDRDFDKADDMREELRSMGVNVDDTELTWRGPGGMEGTVANGGGGGGGGGGGFGGGMQRREGDWDCPSCGKMVFASKEECFSCGTLKPRGGGRDRDDRRGDRYDDRRRERSSYDRYDDRRGERYDDRRSDRYDDRRRERSYDRYDDRRSDRYDDRRRY